MDPQLWQGGASVFSRTAGTAIGWNKEIVLPDGVTITEFRARMFRNVAGDIATCELRRVNDTGTATGVKLLTASTGGWSTQADTTLSETVAHPNIYILAWSLKGNTVNSDALALYAELVYKRFNIQQVL